MLLLTPLCVGALVLSAIFSPSEQTLIRCAKTSFACRCGSDPGYRLDVPIEQCSSLLGLLKRCSPCDNVQPKNVCPKYASCAECRADRDHCLSCPPNRFGRWCTEECHCANGGRCHQMQGHCICSPMFEGPFCELTKGCFVPQVPPPLYVDVVRKEPLRIEFSCQEDFYLKGAKRLQCIGNGNWDHPPPECVKTCPSLPTLVNGRILSNSSIHPILSSVSFECNPSYFLIGASQLHCEANGQWDQAMPTCQDIVFCDDPGLVKNAERTVRKSLEQPYGPYPRGSTIKYACVEDYILIGTPTLMCQYDRSWSSPLPKCLKVSDQVVTCESKGRDLVEDVGVPVQLLCPESCDESSAPIYGTVIYSELSSVCKAAVHAGKTTSAGGIVYVVNNGEFTDFLGSELNEVASNSILAPSGSFRFEQKPEKTEKLSEGCFDGWTKLDKYCVLVTDKPKVWARALDICYNLGSNLPTVEDEKIIKGLSALLQERGVAASWIGLKRDPQTLRYAWNNAKGTMRSLNADPPFLPKQEDLNEDCVVLLADERSSWQKEDCSERVPFICMYDPAENLKVKCPDPERIENGEVKSKNEDPEGFHAGSSIEYSCDPLYVLSGEKTLSCTKNGSWSGPPPKCIKVSACKELPPPAFGFVEMLPPTPTNVARKADFRPGQRLPGRGPQPLSLTPESFNVVSPNQNVTLPAGFYHVGVRASFSCQSRYYQLVGSQTRRCMDDMQWSGRPATCIPVCGRSDSPRSPFIVNGTATAKGQWPWQVGIARWIPDHKLWFLLCGGALLNEKWVLTAAHCVTYSASAVVLEPDKFKVYLGKYYRDDDKDDDSVQTKSVKEIHVHPDFDPAQFDADIALIQLETPAVLTSRVQPICLPSPLTTREHIVDGQKGVVTGWGLNENQAYSDVLQQVAIPVVSHQRCEAAYERAKLPLTVTENMYCAGETSGRHDTCSGDSGGPMVFPDDSGRERRWVIEGVVSWGSPTGCGLAEQYGGFTKVYSFLDWIQQFI